MTEFVDEYLPNSILKYPFTSTPRTSTRITQVKSGHENRNRNWFHPLHKFTSPDAVQCQDDLEDIKDAWFALAGPFVTFPFRDQMDFASRRLVKAGLAPTVGSTDQLIAVADGDTREFQLIKTYAFGTRTYDRKITLPILSTLVVSMNALDPSTVDPTLPGGPFVITPDRGTGKILFDHEPEGGTIIKAGFLFDVIARFEDDDSFESIMQSFQTAGHADLSFVEVRPCEIPGSS